MGNVNLPTPLVVAGGSLCVLGGYLLGVVTGPDTPERTVGVVESFDRATNRLCLSGDTVAEQEGADDSGQLCGTWSRASGSSPPAVGEEFRFVSVRTAEDPDAESADSGVLIYGEVVD